MIEISSIKLLKRDSGIGNVEETAMWFRFKKLDDTIVVHD